MQQFRVCPGTPKHLFRHEELTSSTGILLSVPNNRFPSGGESRYQMSFLAKVNPNKIVIDPGLVQPSKWDEIVVLDDLRAFVAISRIVKATPVLELVDGVLRLVSGEPFVQAARQVEPPLEQVVCLIETNQVNNHGSSLFVPVSPTALLEEYSELEPYQTVEMLSFVDPVTASDKVQIEQEISQFFDEVNNHPTAYGGSYRWMSDFKWDEAEHRVSWVWVRNDAPTKHQQVFLDVLRLINGRIAPLRSWNGLALSL